MQNDELRERARKWLVIQGVYEAERLIRDLLAALDDAEREERERCVKILQGLQSEYNDAGYNGALEDGIIDIRREGDSSNKI